MDEESVGNGDSSDAEGEGEFERTLLEEGALRASIEQRDHDNASIEENILDKNFDFTKTLPGAPEDWQPPQPPGDWVHVPDTSRGKPPFSEVDPPLQMESLPLTGKVHKARQIWYLHASQDACWCTGCTK